MNEFKSDNTSLIKPTHPTSLWKALTLSPTIQLGNLYTYVIEKPIKTLWKSNSSTLYREEVSEAIMVKYKHWMATI